MQRYAYADSDATNLIDPTGLCWVCDVGSAIGHGAENVGHRVVDNVTHPKSLAGDIQAASGVIIANCGVAAATGAGEAVFEVTGPLCGAAILAYGGAVAAQLALADSNHERAVIVLSLGLNEIQSDALAPLAAPGIAEAPGKEGGMRAPHVP